jgi:hypothetical protein
VKTCSKGQQLIDHDCATEVFTVGRNENHDRAYAVHIQITEIPNNLESCIKQNNMVFLKSVGVVKKHDIRSPIEQCVCESMIKVSS